MNDSPKPTRRWYRFSRKTLLLWTFVLCMVFAWVGVRLQRARENRAGQAAVREAVATFERAYGKGYVWFACEGESSPIWLEREFGDPGIPDLPVGVTLDTDLNDNTIEQLAALANLTPLRYLYFTGTNVTATSLEYLEGLTTLKQLAFYDTKVTDEGIEKLQKALPNCEISH